MVSFLLTCEIAVLPLLCATKKFLLLINNGKSPSLLMFKVMRDFKISGRIFHLKARCADEK